MEARRHWLAAVLLLIPVGVSAGDHRFGAFFAPSYLDAKGSELDLKGWHLSGEISLKDHEWFNFAGDFSLHFVGNEDDESEETDPTQLTFALGPRVEIPKSPKHSVFLQAMLVAVVNRSGDGSAAESSTGGALTFGGGYTFDLRGHHGWAIRLQVDYVLPLSNDLGHGWRYSAGLLYRFPH